MIICMQLITSVQLLIGKRKAMLFELGYGSIAFFLFKPVRQNCKVVGGTILKKTQKQISLSLFIY